MADLVSLAPLYVGPLQGFPPAGIGQSPPVGAIHGRSLLDRDALAAAIKRYADHRDSHGERFGAVVSEWSKLYAIALLVPVVSANILLEQDIPIAFDALHLELDENGLPARFWFSEFASPLATTDVPARFSPLLAHLEAIVDVFAALSGYSTKVFWSNAGNVFEHFASAMHRHPLAVTGSGASAQTLIEMRTLHDRRRNPLYQPVRYLDCGGETLRRVRKLCCLRYVLPVGEGGAPYCGACPLRTENKAKALSRNVRRRERVEK
ncbi:siderophore-iron reductase FhuF [Marinivivus vitaminiproducens]|uniref:siderophore-iron reductase FhuF n=1 Tax=Marinivivus vitaminiproducens TaxID=3035935 RepID=UPI00279CA62C|nr:siderophore-iron reductase FhuF [Geminicoccaceae bacterium SCSIO 64248]